MRSRGEEQRWKLDAERAAVGAVVVGAVGLVGWGAGERRLTSAATDFRPMLAHTAIALVLEGVALALLARSRERRRRAARVGRGLALAGVAIGTLELVEWFVGRALLVDRAFAALVPTFLTGLGVVAVGLALLTLDVRTARGRPPSQYLAFACMTSALVVILGYVVQEPALYELPAAPMPSLGMALPSAMGLTLLCIGVLFARPDAGVMRVVTSTEIGGRVARRFLAAILSVPLFGLVGMAGERAHFWHQEVAEGLLATGWLIVGASLVVTTARSLDRLDEARRHAIDDVLEWKEFFERAGWGAALILRDGTIIKANPAYASMHGYEIAEIEMRNITTLLTEDEGTHLSELMNQVDARGQLRFECERRRKDGTRFDAVVDATAVRRADGTVSHYTTYIQDASHRRAAEQAQARLAAIVEASDDAIISSDANGTLLTVNAAAERLFGWTAAELVGKSMTVFMPPDRRDEAATNLAKILRGEHVVGLETMRVRKDGTVFPASITISPVKDRNGRIAMVSIVARDITDKKNVERQREEWASMVAHDLKQPLGAILLHADSAVRRIRHAQPPPDPRVEHSLEQILALTRRLDRMVGDLTDVSRLEASRLDLDLREVDLDELVDGLLARMGPLTATRPLRKRTYGPARRVVVDPARVEQVLTNLLSNALKYGDPGTEIGIDVDYRRAEVEISVTNRGRGIPDEELGRVFGRFERAKGARASGAPGLGVGLYICRGLVEAHHGSIWVESTPNETTTFHVALPDSHAPQPSSSG